jgi:hypothetical protein
MTHHDDTKGNTADQGDQAAAIEPKETPPVMDGDTPDAVDKPKSDATAVKSSASDAVERVSELALALQADLARTAAAIEAGEFAASGSGHAGSLFRAVQVLETESHDHIEAWSILLEVAETLWSGEHHDAGLEFVRGANLYLSTPRIFEDRVAHAIEFAENAILVDRAEKRFSEGDLSGAIGLAQQLKGSDKQAYIEELNLRQKHRRRSRLTAFCLASVAIASLLGVSVTGVMQMRDLLKNPPTVSLPEFPNTDLIDDLKNSRIIEGELPTVSDILDRIKEENLTSGSATAEPQISPATEETNEIDPSQQVEAITTPVQPKPSDVNPAPYKEGETSAPTSKQTASAAMIYNCALGQAVSKRAIELVIEAQSQNRAGVEAFVKKVNAACAALDTTQADLDAVAAQIPKAQIETMAKNIAP